MVPRNLATYRSTSERLFLRLVLAIVDGHVKVSGIKHSWILIVLDLSVGLPSILVVAFIIIEFRPCLIQLSLDGHLVFDYLVMRDACIASLLLFCTLDVCHLLIWVLVVLN